MGFNLSNPIADIAVIGGAALGGPVGAGLAMGGLGMMGQDSANQANEDIAKQQMWFQGRMSDTAHQREVADLKAAGLNPILSANSGASTPSGASATMQNAMAPLVSSAMQGYQMQKDFESKDSQIAYNAAAANAANAGATKDLANAKESGVRSDVLAAQQAAIKAEALVRKQTADFANKTQSYRNVKGLVDGMLGTANSAKDLITPMKAGSPWQGIPRGGSLFNPGTGEIVSPP